MTSDGLLENGFMGFSAKVGEFPGWDRKWEPQKIATYPQTPTLVVGRESPNIDGHGGDFL